MATASTGIFATYAVVLNNQVKSLISLDTGIATGLAFSVAGPPFSGLVQSNTAQVSQLYVSGSFVTPGTVSSATIYVTPYAFLRKISFRNRFTTAEKTTMYNAKGGSVQLQIFLDDVLAYDYIDPFDPYIITSCYQLEQASLIGNGRANTIITTTPTSAETYNGTR